MWVYCRQHLYTLGGLHYEIQMACHNTCLSLFETIKEFKILLFHTARDKPKFVYVGKVSMKALIKYNPFKIHI